MRNSIAILLIIIGIAGATMGLYYNFTAESQKIVSKVNCYDQYYNKIIGVECESITYKTTPDIAVANIMVFMSIFVLSAGLANLIVNSPRYNSI